MSEVTVTLISDLWPSNSNQFIVESQRTFAPNLKTFPLGILVILCSHDWDVAKITVSPHQIGGGSNILEP